MRVAFRPRLEGWERFPSDRPFLVVANHSGGGAADIMCLTALWFGRFGGERPITGMANPSGFFLPGVSRFLRGVGAIPSTRAAAEEALAQGLPVIVFPGGDHEAYRPVWQARRVNLAGRKGFLRLARQARVPILPLGIYGSHYTLPILFRSRVLALLPRVVAGVKRYPLSLTGLVGAVLIACWLGPSLGIVWTALLAYLWIVTPIASNLPVIPWSVRIRVGELLEPEDLFQKPDDEGLAEAYVRVETAIQGLVDAAVS